MYFVLFFTIVIWICQLFFSYFFVDNAILLMMSPVYPKADKLFGLVEYGNTHRGLMTTVWIVIILILTGIQIFWLYYKKKSISRKSLLFVLVLISIIAAVSYPIVSQDIFNYLFAGKVVVYYHENPFLVTPKQFFQNDLWLRFMRNIDNVYYNLGNWGITYFYGPVFLLYTLIPFLIFGPVQFQKLFWGYKLMGAALFLLTGWLIKKNNPNDKLVWAYWFFNPFLIFELLLNSHNDLIMIFLFVLSIYLWQKNRVLSIFVFILSVLTKMISGIFFVIYFVKGKKREIFFKIFGFIILFYHAFTQKHSWYYSWIYMVFPFAKLKKSTWLCLFVLQTIVVLNYSGFLLLNRTSPNSFTLFTKYAKWVLPILMLINEYGKILSIKFTQCKSNLIFKK